MSVVIVGSGLIGLSAALHLRRADPSLAVTVFARLALGRDALPPLWRDLRFDRPALAGS
jgi:glycine/D-amino acid oxidase-like deaminating enzyme